MRKIYRDPLEMRFPGQLSKQVPGFRTPLSQSKPGTAASVLSGFFTSFWKLDDVTDSIGSNTLTNNGTVTFTAGKIGNAANFIPASVQTLSHADATSLRGTTSFTISVWIKLTDRTSVYVIVAKSLYSASNTGEFFLEANNGGSAGRIRFGIQNGSNYDILVANNAIPDTNYHLLVAWWDSGTSKLNLSVDGGAAVQQATAQTPVGTAVPFTIGGDGNATPGLRLNGQVDALGFAQGKTPSVAQIAAMWNSGAGKEPPF